MIEKLDETDRAILRRLQGDATISLESLAAVLDVSVNTCWRRVKRLEEAGVITRRVALVDPDRVGLSVTIFVAIRTSDHSAEWTERFAKTVRAIPEVVEFYRMAGEVDYLLKVLCASVADYDRVYRKLIAEADLADVSASFAMERLKETTIVPV